jgi:uncharacterized protein YecE (DUF72 family)
VEFRIGTGGWQYFPVPIADKLKGLSKLFDFVEVNSTFYTHLPLSTVRRWREAVPPEFEFSAKCSRDVTAALRSGNRSQLAREIEYMGRVCEILDASVLVLQTPAGLNLEKMSGDDLIYLADFVRDHGLRLAWEIRSQIPIAVSSMLRSLGVIMVADLSRESPHDRTDILYTRLFGLGQHNMYRFTDHDFKRIGERASSSGSGKAYFAFHGVAMYADAVKFKRAIETGEAAVRPLVSGSRLVP